MTREEGETPLMRQYNEIKRQHLDKILLFQMGDFFEMFGEDAVVAAKALNIQLTTRDKNTKSSVPLCGIPQHACDQYLNKLIRLGFKVAVCEQVGDPKQSKGIVDRQVTGIVTPGTTLSHELLEPAAFSYVSSVIFDKKEKQAGIAFCDLSTGEFLYSSFEASKAVEQIRDLLTLYEPKEILLHTELKSERDGGEFNFGELFDFLKERKIRIEEVEISPSNLEKNRKELKRLYGQHALPGLGLENNLSATAACGELLAWLQNMQRDKLNHLRPPRQIEYSDRMILDLTTISNLEIFENLAEKDNSHTLFHLMNQTKTPMGSRLLRKNLASPFRNKEAINQRFDAIEEARAKSLLTENLNKKFHTIGDLERTMARISLPGISIYDVLKLREGIAEFPEIFDLINCFDSIFLKDAVNSFDKLEDIHRFLNESIQANPNFKLKEGGFIAENFSKELDDLRALQTDAKTIISNLEESEKKRTGINSLKIRYNRVFGYFIEIPNTWKHLVPENYVCKQTLSNAERYITQELKELEEKILNAEERIISLEMELFETVKTKIRECTRRVQKTAACIARFDVILALAKLSLKHNYCRPSFTEEGKRFIKLSKSRHPVIEALDFDEPFIPNDLELKRSDKYMMLITGPNMGGKSTFMRQTALIACMAQAGSFVPAESATLPLFDRVFTRVGASDNLARGQSTFMVEMNEAAVILNNATENSLVILDEIGRGTGTYDGISIAWAIACQLHSTGCFTLFATHYHELTALEDECQGIRNASVTVKDDQGKIVFLRKIIPGKANKSYGIQVAKLAGLPEKVIRKAESVLVNLQTSEEEFKACETGGTWSSRSRKTKKQPVAPPNLQTILFEEKNENNEIKEKIKECNINQMSPIEAIGFLNELKKISEA